ncbi:alkaline phosphatase-like isoform X2 [Babylonia areolata]
MGSLKEGHLRWGLAVCVCWSVCQLADSAANTHETAATWQAMGEREVEEADSLQLLRYRARNVILFLGDGMGISTITSARILKGGESSTLFFERFPHSALSKTYCADHQVTDSAASSTAFQCGVKTNKGLLGLDQRVPRDDCRASLQGDMQLSSILDWSLAEGKSVGLVTNTRITHATPGGAYANTADRDWEGDSKLSDSARQHGCRDIARQLIEDYSDVQVILGGGRQYFLPNTTADPNTGSPNTAHGRLDSRDLTEEWLNGQRSKGRCASYVWNAGQLRQLNLNSTDYLFGLFAQSHMDYDQERDTSQQPSLAEMTRAAITILSRNPKGFYLLVEGGRIDHSHHTNVAHHALYDTLAFDDAVEAASQLTSVQDTLTVTTADHSHSLVIAGYASRGNPIFNVVDTETDSDGKNYTTLLYGEGPGYRHQMNRVSVTNQESNDPDYKQESAVPLHSSTHSGEDVAIYAKGPMAHLFHGVHEENFIAHVMAYASCVGNFRQKGKCPPLPPGGSGSGSGTNAGSSIVGWDVAGVVGARGLLMVTVCLVIGFGAIFE